MDELQGQKPTATEQIRNWRHEIRENEDAMNDPETPAEEVGNLWRHNQNLREQIKMLQPQADLEADEADMATTLHELVLRLPGIQKMIAAARPEVVTFLKGVIEEITGTCTDLKEETKGLAAAATVPIATVYQTLITAHGVTPESATQIVCAMIKSGYIPKPPFVGMFGQAISDPTVIEMLR